MGSVMASGNSADSASPSPSSILTYSRRAHHAGSWYDDRPDELRDTLSKFLAEARREAEAEEQGATAVAPGTSLSSSRRRLLRAVIVPHAGYSYSGPTAAHAYSAVEERFRKDDDDGGDNNNNKEGSSPSPPGPPRIEHVVVLHPSHHVYLEGCAVSGAHQLETPAGNLPVSNALRDEILHVNDDALLKTKYPSHGFTVMSQSDDEREHSGEMQYPYLAYVLACHTKNQSGRTVAVLPIMVGALSHALEEHYGALLAPILARPNVLTVVSSDFCHWGSRFSYRPAPPSTSPAIFEFIEQLDRRGMDLIEWQQPGAFARYLRETRNTICGRHAIAVFLQALVRQDKEGAPCASTSLDSQLEIKFVKYAQSSQVRSMHDSSVSYAVALATVPSS